MGLFPGKFKVAIDLLAGWKIGGVAVTATAAELNKLAGATVSTAEINALAAANAGANGLGFLRVAKATYDFAVNGGAQGAISLGTTLPAKAVIVGGFMRVIAQVTGVGASVAVSVESANDIQAAAAINGAPWSTTGLKAIVPKANTPEATGILLATTAKPVVATVTGADLTAGKFEVFLYYVVSS